MPVFNTAGQEINAKIVYYGPGVGGKTTNLEFIYAKLPRESRGKMVSMKTRTDRTLFFDFLPIDVGEINGMKVRFLLYTVPGQVYYNATRKLVLKGVDAVVFVADSASDRMQDNKESLQNLEDNLNDLGMTLSEIPWVLQLNKRDLPNALDRATAERELNALSVPCFEAVANKGDGVYETFEGIAKLVFKSMQNTVRNPDKPREVRETNRESRLAVEVVAKSKREENSETDGSDYRYSAEKREEEQKSVSEFVDTVLTEQGPRHESVDLGATRVGYEDYGHVVELSGEENGAKRPEPEKRPEKGDILNVDPLEALAQPSDTRPPKAQPPQARPPQSQPPQAKERKAAPPSQAAEPVAEGRMREAEAAASKDAGGRPAARVEPPAEENDPDPDPSHPGRGVRGYSAQGAPRNRREVASRKSLDPRGGVSEDYYRNVLRVPVVSFWRGGRSYGQDPHRRRRGERSQALRSGARGGRLRDGLGGHRRRGARLVRTREARSRHPRHQARRRERHRRAHANRKAAQERPRHSQLGVLGVQGQLPDVGGRRLHRKIRRSHAAQGKGPRASRGEERPGGRIMRRAVLIVSLLVLAPALCLAQDPSLERPSVFNDFLNPASQGSLLGIPGLSFHSSAGFSYYSGGREFGSFGMGYYMGHFGLQLASSLTLSWDIGVGTVMKDANEYSQPRFFIPNVDLTYRPSESFTLRLQFQQLGPGYYQYRR